MAIIMKKSRRATILEIVSSHDVETQEDLLNLLRKQGIEVTQATISRDIKELRLVKHMTKDGKYRYATGVRDEKNDDTYRVYSILSDSVIQVDYALNTVVIRCYTGMAQAACAAIDSMHWDGLVGTIAGDDTIFALMRTEEIAEKFVSNIMHFVGKQL